MKARTPISDEDEPIIIRISTFGYSKEKRRQLIQYYIKGELNQEEIESQYMSYEKNMKVEGEYITLKITDSENIDKYNKIPLSSIHKETGLIFIYDANDEKGFEKLSNKFIYPDMHYERRDFLLIGDTSNMSNVDNTMKEITDCNIGSYCCIAHYQMNCNDKNSIVNLMENYVTYLISQKIDIKLKCIFIKDEPSERERRKKKCAK